jgi:hypothetical protein
MRRVFPLVTLLAVVAAGCDKNSEPVPIPTPVAPATITENFSGTLFASGSNLHSFEVKQGGQVFVTVTSVNTVGVAADPNADPPVLAVPSVPVTIPLTINVGQPALTTLGVQCSHLKSVEAPAGPSPQLSGQALAGQFCVSLSDPTGALPAASAYAITVSHS